MVGSAEDIIKYLINQDRKKQYELKEYKKKRSLNANNYFWELCTELANVLRVSKEEMYFLLLQKYGQSEMVSVVANIDVSGYFKYYIEAGESTIKGIKFKHYKVYKGSSEMNQKEMSILIEGLVQECNQQNILTRPKEATKDLLEGWDNV